MKKFKENKSEICGIAFFLSAAIAFVAFGPYNWIQDEIDVIIVLSIFAIIGLTFSGITWVVLSLISRKAQNKINQKFENLQKKVLNFWEQEDEE